MANPLSRKLPAAGLQIENADPPTDKTVPSLDEVIENVAMLKGEKASDVSNITAELIKAEGQAMTCELLSVWQYGTIPCDW